VLKPTAAAVLSGVGLIAACSSGATGGVHADIAKISTVKSRFGPQFQVTDIPPTGIDPKLLAGQKLPDGVRFAPADCAEFITGQALPANAKGNMAAVSAEGDGNRFIVIAVETNEPVPVNVPGPQCQKVSFDGGPIRGTVEVAEAPKIDGAQTLGVHRVLQTIVDGRPRTGEVFNLSAHFGDYQVLVTANPLVLPDQPTVPVDTQRARDLLVAGVDAIRN
jgi:hypothetical protein